MSATQERQDVAVNERVYDVVALSMPIALNTAGDHIRDGQIYALKHNVAHLEQLRAAFRPTEPHPLVRPLVLRACVGETITINLENALAHRAVGLRLGGDSTVAADTTQVAAVPPVPAGGRRSYRWLCRDEGVVVFYDADAANGSGALTLCGALVVEPAGATWTDPSDGLPICDGLYADVHPRRLQGSFREYVLFLHDPVAVGGAQVLPVSFRAVPPTAALPQADASQTPILSAYAGDPLRIRLVHTGVREPLLYHLPQHEWYALPESEAAPLLDTVALSPLSAQTVEPRWGAGSRERTTGDIVWHCDAYPHVQHGSWGVLRTYGVLQDGISTDPAQPPLPRLVPLPDREPPRRARRPSWLSYFDDELAQQAPRPPWPDPGQAPPADAEPAPEAEAAPPAFTLDSPIKEIARAAC